MTTYLGGVTLQLPARDGGLYARQTVDVYEQGTDTRAALYNSRAGTTEASNPAYTDAYGRLTLYAAAGYYDVTYDSGRVTIEDVAVGTDPAETVAKIDELDPAAVIATADGLTTGIVPTTAVVVTATNATNANDIITLPTPSAGKRITVIAVEACEVRTADTSSITINDVDSDGTNEAALPAGSVTHFTGVSATAWVAEHWIADGTPTKLVPDTA